MTKEQLKSFLEAVKADTSLQEKLKTASSPDDVVSIAKGAGFAISSDNLMHAQSELGEEELELVVGASYTGTYCHAVSFICA